MMACLVKRRGDGTEMREDLRDAMAPHLSQIDRLMHASASAESDDPDDTDF
jgi:hypothetical protein